MTQTKQLEQFALSNPNDVTDRILQSHKPDPLYSPLPPSYDELTEYAEDLEHWGNHITYEWASNEIMTHRMGWIRMGLVADRLRRYRLYKDKFTDWNTYCKKCLGLQNWQVNKVIKYALVAIDIIRHGAIVLPTCKSHVEKLLECCKKTGVDHLKAWDIVTERLPEQSLITAKNICEVLGFPMEDNRQIRLPRYLRDRLQNAAFREGITLEEKISQLLDEDEGIEPEAETQEDSGSEQEEKEQAWRDDLNQLIQEHDREIWLMTAISKLIHQGKRKISQFSYLKQLRYQS